MFFLLVFAYLERILERPTSYYTDPLQNFNSYFNSVWFTIITFCTVGYGEYWAKSLPGKLFGFIIMFIGCILTSLFVVSLTSALMFNKPQENSFTLIQRMIFRDNLKLNAAKAIQFMWKFKRVEVE